MAACGSDRHAWHSDDDGKYDVQQLEKISDLTMRAACGQMNGHFHLWSIKPAAYPIPHDGPVGDMHTASPEKAPVAPAQVHFMIEAPGHEKLVTHVFVEGDEHIDCDVVFRVTDSLIRRFEQRPASVAPEGKRVDRPHRHLNYVFGLKPMGTCTGEHGHGIGTGNMALQTELGETMDLLRAVKLALDPQNIMYPRKIFRLEIER
jgi:hydroxyquinol 1,2-dioxygenase